MAKQLDKMCEHLTEDADKVLTSIQKAQQLNKYDNEAFKKHTIITFINYSIKDILILYKLFILTDNDVEKNLIARTLIMHVAELIDDAGKLIGKPLENYVDALKDDDIIIDNLKVVRELFNVLKKEYSMSKTIRNYVSAHKDPNILKQLQIMNDLDLKEIPFLMVKIELFMFACVKFERVFVGRYYKAYTNKLQD